MTEQQLREQLDAVYASTSWKITAPFRFLTSSMKSGGFRPGSLAKPFLSALHWAARQPHLRFWGVQLLRRFPRLEKQIRSLMLVRYKGRQLNSFTPSLAGEEPLYAVEGQFLTPAADAILRELHFAIQNAK